MAYYAGHQDMIQPSGAFYGNYGSMQAMPYDHGKLDASYAMGANNGGYMSAPYGHHTTMGASRVIGGGGGQYMQRGPQPQMYASGIGHGHVQSDEGIVRDVVHGTPSTISERITEQHGNQYMLEKFIEAPQTIIKEREREVRKPVIIERIIEVPKPELKYIDRPAAGGDRIIDQEQIVEVPQIVTEEIVTRVPRKEIQERLIEIPKIEYVERIEYEDMIEYREVCVDKIIEVPEVEYVVREVERLVPQTYVEEYFVDNYKEMPMYQVQEVERIENVPVAVQAPVMQPGVVLQPVRQAQRKGHWVQQWVDEGEEIVESLVATKVPQQAGNMVQQVNQKPHGGFLSYGYSSMPMKGQAAAPVQQGTFQSGAVYKSPEYTSGFQPVQQAYGSYASYAAAPQQAMPSSMPMGSAPFVSSSMPQVRY